MLMVQKINPHPAPGCNRSPPTMYFQKVQFVGVFHPFLQRSLDQQIAHWLFVWRIHIWSWQVCKEWLKMKMTKLWVGYFMIISCHFFTNYINNFHKTEELKVVLVYPIYKNINWIKSYDINNNFCFVSVFSIL